MEKTKRRRNRKTTEERKLEFLLFGDDEDGHNLLSPSSSNIDVETKVNKYNETTDLSVIEKSGNKKRKGAWFDEDDSKVQINIANSSRLRKLRKNKDDGIISGKEYQERLRDEFTKLTKAVRWDKIDDEKNISNEKAFPSAIISSGSGGYLSKNIINISRLKNANHQEYSKSVIKSIGFHSDRNIMFTAGLDKKLRIFEIDGLDNPKLQSVHFSDLPIHSAAFLNEEEVVLSGRRKFFYTYNIEANKEMKIPFIRNRKEKSFETFKASPNGDYLAFTGLDGNIILVSGKTKQYVTNFKITGSVRDISFSGDGNYIYSIGSDGVIFIWDMRTRKCIHRQSDDGCVKGTCISADENGMFFATGSDSGVVNIYEPKFLGNDSPKPLKSLFNLTTPIDYIKFNYDSQLMAMASRRKKDSLRLVHLPSFSVFSNWPTSGTPLHFISSIAFSPKSGYLAVGNDKGKVLLYRLHHFPHF